MDNLDETCSPSTAKPATPSPSAKLRSSIGLLKALAGALAEVAVLPALLQFKIESLVLEPNSACLDVTQAAARWTGLVGMYLRRALLKHIIAKVGSEVLVGTGTVLTKTSIELGDRVYIGSYGILGNVCIGDNTLVGDRVSFISGQHGIAPDALIKDQPEEFRRIMIGADCWIGSGAIVMADVGDHSVVGAGSVVTKPVSKYMIVAGNPAKPIGDRRLRKAAD